MKKFYFLISFLFLTTQITFGQIAAWNLTSETTSATSNDVNLTASSIIVVPTSTISYQSGPGDIYCASWSQSSTFSTSGKYWEFSITPTIGYQISISSASFDAGRTSEGPQLMQVQYSLDGFTTAGATALAETANSNTSTLTTFNFTNFPVATTNTITFRIWGYAASGTGNFRLNNVVINGSLSTTPTISVLPTSLSGLTYLEGSGGPSTSQSYNLSGSNLTPASGDITVTGSTDYEVSKDNTTFSNSVSVAYTGSTLTATPIYVRLKAGLIAGAYNGQTISNAGGGASTINVTCNDSVVTYTSSIQSGNWSDASTWDIGVVPGASDDVFIKSTHTVTLTGDASCKNLTLELRGSGTSLAIGDNTLSVNGTLQSTAAATLSTSLITTGTGKLSFTGNSRDLFGSNWQANTANWRFEVALNPGQTGTVNSNIKGGEILIASGTLDMGAAASRNLSADVVQKELAALLFHQGPH
jgi:hypothetical protein